MSRILWPGCRGQLGGEVALLRPLRFLQARPRPLEIGAGILHVGIEEEAVDPPVEIVVVLDVAARPHGGIVLRHPPRGEAKARQSPVERPLVEKAPALVQEHQEIEQRIVREDEAAIHVGFADRELRIDEDRPFGLAVAELDASRASAAVAVGGDAPVGPGYLEPAQPNDPGHQAIEPTVHSSFLRRPTNPGRPTIFAFPFKYCLRRGARTPMR